MPKDNAFGMFRCEVRLVLDKSPLGLVEEMGIPIEETIAKGSKGYKDRDNVVIAIP